jgi:hypothetical protein
MVNDYLNTRVEGHEEPHASRRDAVDWATVACSHLGIDLPDNLKAVRDTQGPPAAAADKMTKDGVPREGLHGAGVQDAVRALVHDDDDEASVGVGGTAEAMRPDDVWDGKCWHRMTLTGACSLLLSCVCVCVCVCVCLCVCGFDTR